MRDLKLTWYSLDRDLRTVAHAPVSLHEALEIAGRYYRQGGRTFEHGEEALAATMFGFNRSEHEFIELSVAAPDQIGYKFESAAPGSSWLRRVFGGTFQFETTLRTEAEMAARVEEFFTLPPAEIKAKLERSA